LNEVPLDLGPGGSLEKHILEGLIKSEDKFNQSISQNFRTRGFQKGLTPFFILLNSLTSSTKLVKLISSWGLRRDRSNRPPPSPRLRQDEGLRVSKGNSRMKYMKINIVKLIVSILVCQLAGIIGSIFTAPSVATWYLALNKPSFTPPNWLFAPVWIILFLLMGISLYLIWQKGFAEKENKKALLWFILQLVFNILWSFVFFGLQSPIYGLVVIVILWIFILETILQFMKISKLAGKLLIPYILWVTLAAFLNFSIWQLNM